MDPADVEFDRLVVFVTIMCGDLGDRGRRARREIGEVSWRR
jgi:hypothetical protein